MSLTSLTSPVAPFFFLNITPKPRDATVPKMVKGSGTGAAEATVN